MPTNFKRYIQSVTADQTQFPVLVRRDSLGGQLSAASAALDLAPLQQAPRRASRPSVWETTQPMHPAPLQASMPAGSRAPPPPGPGYPPGFAYSDEGGGGRAATRAAASV